MTETATGLYHSNHVRFLKQFLPGRSLRLKRDDGKGPRGWFTATEGGYRAEPAGLPMKDFEAVKQALNQAGIPWLSAELTMLPSSTVPIQGEATAKRILGFMEVLEEHEDVSHAYANFDIPDNILAAAN